MADGKITTKIAIVGTGFVADYYIKTLRNHPELELVGAWDKNPARLKQFADYYNINTYDDLQTILDDKNVDIVVNLTTPESHYEINKLSLLAGKHVYCEKPLALDFNHAKEVVELANERGLTLCAAPANGLSDAFDAFSKLLNIGDIGTPRLVYVEMEDGPVFRGNWTEWKSESGAPWPGIHEFETGCTLEHVGYGLSWLIRIFGPVKSVETFSHLAFPNKGEHCRDLELAPDFSVGSLVFESGVVARITCGLAAPRDRSFTVLGDEGHLIARDLWDNASAIHLSKPGSDRTILQKVFDKLENILGESLPIRFISGKNVSYENPNKSASLPRYPSQIDFARGIAVQAKAIKDGSVPFYSGDVALHLTELALLLNNGENRKTMQSTFDIKKAGAES